MLTIDGLAACPGLVHGFSTNVLGPMQRGDGDGPLTGPRRAFAGELDLDPERMTLIGAVHGTAVARVDAPRGVVDDVDALVTDRPRLPLFGTFADCRPLIIYDVARHALALCHAGWRGTASGMAAAGVASLAAMYGSRPGDLVAGIGPGICGDCYEVGPEVAARFPADCVSPGRSGRLQLDLVAVNRHQLVGAGVRSEAIFVHPACTMESPLLPSHRQRPDGTRFATLAALR